MGAEAARESVGRDKQNRVTVPGAAGVRPAHLRRAAGLRAGVRKEAGTRCFVFFFNPHNFYSIHCHGRKAHAELTDQTELIFQSVIFSLFLMTSHYRSDS